jgi:transcriptional regulator with XRE-family HTH domain
MLQISQPAVKAFVASGANDHGALACHMLHMAQPTRIHQAKTPKRIHYIVEWAERRGLKQSEVTASLGVDKSTVSRWFSGQVPTDKYIHALAGLFELEQPSDLFRHPDDDWLSRFFRDRTEAERDRAIQILRAAFPVTETRRQVK